MDKDRVKGKAKDIAVACNARLENGLATRRLK
jgi:hypothetical protein